MANVTEIQKRINAIQNEDPTEPTQGGTDWNMNLKFMNMALNEWQESYEWPTLYKEVNTNTSQSTGNASISLPSDFRKLDNSLRVGSTPYPEIDPQKRWQYTDSSEYSYILGYPGSYTLVLNPSPLASGASIFYSYWATAGSLASPTDVPMIPDVNYLVYRSLAYIWESKDDGRFIQAKSEADRIMTRMLEYEQVKGHSYDDRIQTQNESSYGFRIGRD